MEPLRWTGRAGKMNFFCASVNLRRLTIKPLRAFSIFAIA